MRGSTTLPVIVFGLLALGNFGAALVFDYGEAGFVALGILWIIVAVRQWFVARR